MLRNLRININYYFHSLNRGWLLGGVTGVLLAGGLVWLVQTMLESRHDAREVECLARNIYYEARGEPEAGMYAVGVVTMNRVRSPSYPNEVCKVVYQWVWDAKSQRNVSAFSWTTQRVDLALQQPAWNQAREIARQIYFAEYTDTVDNALFYHADYIRPSWASRKIKVKKIGRHIFYK